MTVLLLGMTVCLIPVVGSGYQSRRHRIQQEELQARQREDGEQKDQKRIEALPAVTEAEDNEGKNAEESTEPVILDQYAALYEDNRDLRYPLQRDIHNCSHPCKSHVPDNIHHCHTA